MKLDNVGTPWAKKALADIMASKRPLSNNESSFISNITPYIQTHRPLSDKQILWLNKIHEKTTTTGAPRYRRF